MLRALPVRSRRRTVVLAAAVLAAVLLIVVLVTGWPGGGSSDTTTLKGYPSVVLYTAGHRPVAPGFTGTTLAGSKLSLSSYRGKTVVLNFWGSWCVPCRAEAPVLGAVAARYRSSGVSFVGVDVRDTTASAQAFVSQFRVGYPSIGDPGSVITADFSDVVPIAATPTTLVIDRTGHIAGAVFNSVSYPELTTLLTTVTAKGG